MDFVVLVRLGLTVIDIHYEWWIVIAFMGGSVAHLTVSVSVSGTAWLDPFSGGSARLSGFPPLLLQERTQVKTSRL